MVRSTTQLVAAHLERNQSLDVRQRRLTVDINWAYYHLGLAYIDFCKASSVKLEKLSLTASLVLTIQVVLPCYLSELQTHRSSRPWDAKYEQTRFLGLLIIQQAVAFEGLTDSLSKRSFKGLENPAFGRALRHCSAQRCASSVSYSIGRRRSGSPSESFD